MVRVLRYFHRQRSRLGRGTNLTDIARYLVRHAVKPLLLGGSVLAGRTQVAMPARTWAAWAIAVGFIVDGVLTVSAFAQSTSIERDLEETRPGLPSLEPVPVPDFALPPLPSPTKRDQRTSSGVRIDVKEVIFKGNETFSDEELSELVKPYVGRAVTTEELIEMREALTTHYVDAGYVTSGAVIPEQDVADGIVEVQLIEGRLSSIDISGIQVLDQDYVESRIRLGAGPPLNVNRLSEEIRLLLVDPSTNQVNAKLGPGARPGEGLLEVDLVEASQYRFDFRLSNDRSPSIGAENFELVYRVANVLGRSDPLNIGINVSEGLRDVDASYSVPLTPSDFRFFVFGALSETEVVEEPFNEIDVESKSDSLRLGFSYPIIRKVDNELRFDIAGERKRTRSFLLGEPFSFSAGVQDGESVVTSVQATQSWRLRSRERVFALRSTGILGVDALGSTIASDNDIDVPAGASAVPDSEFFAWLGQAQLAQRLFGTDWQLNLRGDIQLTPDPLLATERIAIGGSDTVRGYRENQLVLDNGWVGSAELRIPVGSLRVPYLSSQASDGALQLVPFVDLGGGYNIGAPEPEDDTLLSVGGGLRWQLNDVTNLRLDVGVPLKDVPESDDKDLQDYGIHFELSTSLN